MKYEEFKAKILEELRGFYGEKADVELEEALMNNGKRKGAVQIRIGGEESSTVPFIYLGDFFRMYDAGEMDMEGCIKGIVRLRKENGCRTEIAQFAGRVLDWEYVRGKVYPALLSTEGNRELLGRLASRSLLDLSVIYVIRGTADGGGSYSVKITRGLMKAYGIDEGQLYGQAMQNLEKDGYRFFEMGRYVQEQMEGTENGGMQGQESLEEGKMYILRNTSGLYGAAGILNGNLIRDAAKGHDCFILPSSIHETIFLPVSVGQDQKELDAMVAEINKMCVDEEERLVDHSYYYDAETGRIRICA